MTRMSDSKKEDRPKNRALGRDAPAVSADAFAKHLEYVSNIVSTWPAWKQELLGGKASPPPPPSK